ncbi:hypothetical protein SAMN05428945_6117 [Streptomyces sp. 2224.1]|nr:hypothetical protein BX261_6422 [Streptomyces sp. 2321.6]SDQ87868.1 hypothetical protein SAMN05216511_0830 [Streptomyces sp. KS_16]SED70341.1 hypothetical protein SAMN05428954_0806 [Streptomyces sp. 2112.3]SED93920.1 hypothetical protein SAMN05428945_6117 [Streptomyces sp. 2224.1]SED95510.1 hypothetical protein SAMN05428940_6448 [Streptomyces sp. 2133.1]SNC73226.1 hypothetical protein SAMN06272741_6349 [Streptomyces sp. 2114.4]
MRNHIGRFFELLLKVLLPAPGHHRAVRTRPVVGCVDTPTISFSVPRVLDPYLWDPIRAEDVQLVRPYLVAHEQPTQRRAESDRYASSLCDSPWMAVTL